MSESTERKYLPNRKFPHPGVVGVAQQRHLQRFALEPVMHPQAVGPRFQKALRVRASRRSLSAGTLQTVEHRRDPFCFALG